ncbi:hypothetical protein PFISCL1PPCAC_16867, partial [Pristionchus fissidentatus]
QASSVSSARSVNFTTDHVNMTAFAPARRPSQFWALQSRPRCRCGHKMLKTKSNFGRNIFACPNQANSCKCTQSLLKVDYERPICMCDNMLEMRICRSVKNAGRGYYV